MGKAFIIPDVHLKPWMFDEAELLINKGGFDYIVCLGDIPDDWGMEYHLDLYRETYDALTKFAEKHNNMLFCWGNHDRSYIWELIESGYSTAAKNDVLEGISKFEKVLPIENIKYIHKIDNTLFSHAGLLDVFVRYFAESYYNDTDAVLEKVNSLGKRAMWDDNSPIWTRPQGSYGMRLYKDTELYQVVGHTPVSEPQKEGHILTLDTFSTYSDGTPIGDMRFVYVDTENGKYKYVSDKSLCYNLDNDYIR